MSSAVLRQLARITFLAVSVLACPHVASAQARFDLLHEFSDANPEFYTAPKVPSSSIMQASDGSFYLTSPGGGTHRKGAIFRMSPDGTLSLLHSFLGEPDGAMPAGALLQASDGAFLGVTASGGAAGRGTVYRMTPDAYVTIVHSFTGPDGAWPLTAPIEASDGYVYGTTSDGGGDLGSVFKMTRTGTMVGVDAIRDTRGQLQAADGSRYLVTRREVYRYAYWVDCGCLTGRLVATSPEGQVFYGSPVEVSSGIYLLATKTSAAAAERTIVNVTTGTVRNLPPGSNGPDPIGTLVSGADGSLYGTTARDGAFGRGTIFRMTPAGDVTIVASFASGRTGDLPAPTLIASTDGNFYGTTASIGPGPGIVFKVTPAGVVTFLAAFDHADTGANPVGALVEGSDGLLYGTTSTGGAFAHGTAFSMTPGGAVRVLHNFRGGRGGASPQASLVQASDGYFYGTTNRGGTSDFGTVFRMDSLGTVTILHEFAGGGQGSFPAAALVEGFDGNFYGTTVGARSILEAGAGPGTAFRMTPAGQVTILHVFAGGVADGENPIGPLVRMGNGTFIGMTALGGDRGSLGTAGSGPFSVSHRTATSRFSIRWMATMATTAGTREALAS